MKKKIVIVEDNLIIQELHKHYVLNLGHEVVACFENGQDVINFFEENTADLILMDIRLGDDIDGINASNIINQILPVPIVYVSANSDDNTYGRAILSNMKVFLSKPISASELESALEDLSNLNESILYAEKIQKSFFPQANEITECFGKNIYLNRPKDVISGDFLILNKREGECIGLIGDCTGHGVPGALLSILCAQLVSDTIAKSNDINAIVDNFSNKLKNILSRGNKEFEMEDSLDYSIFKINKIKSEIEITGLNRTFIYYKAKTNKHAVMQITERESIFRKNKIKIYKKKFTFKYKKNDIFYFFSDGIADQFGGENDKKLTIKRIISFLEQKVTVTDLQEKQILLNLFLRKWQGNNKQTDDIIFLGINPSQSFQD